MIPIIKVCLRTPPNRGGAEIFMVPIFLRSQVNVGIILKNIKTLQKCKSIDKSIREISVKELLFFATVPMRVAAPRRGPEFGLPGRGRRP